MKQGKTEKAVFTKLSTEKVELGKIDDMRTLLDKADNKFSQTTRFSVQAEEGFKEAAAAYEQVLKVVAETEQFLKEAEAKGFPQNSVRPAVEKFKQQASKMVKQSNKYAQTASSISKF